MNKIISVLVNGENGVRKQLRAELLEERKDTVIVKLPDGNIVKRKKKRDLV